MPTGVVFRHCVTFQIFSLFLCDIEVGISSIMGLGGAALNPAGDATLGRTANRPSHCWWALHFEGRKWFIMADRRAAELAFDRIEDVFKREDIRTKGSSFGSGLIRLFSVYTL